MKKNLYFALTLLLATSCLNKGKYSSTDQQMVDFQAVVSANIFTDDAMDHYDKSFQYLSYFFYAAKPVKEDGTIDTDAPFTGGCAIGRISDTTLVTRTVPFSHYSVYDKPQDESNVSNYFVVYEDNEDDEQNPFASISYAYSVYGDASPVAIKVNNTTETVACAMGLVPGCTVKDGDYLKATFYGYKGDAENNTLSGSVEVYLLDFRTAHDLVSEWTAVDLRAMKDLDYIKIKVESNNPMLPRRFCIDDFQSSVTINM